MQKFIYENKETGEKIEATPEKWAWGIVYKDGTEFKQFGDDGTFHKFAEINQKEVETFVMYMLEDTAKLFAINPNGSQIFHFYRNTVTDAGTENEKRSRVYVFGFKGKDETIYNYIMPDNKCISTRGDNLIIK